VDSPLWLNRWYLSDNDPFNETEQLVQTVPASNSLAGKVDGIIISGGETGFDVRARKLYLSTAAEKPWSSPQGHWPFRLAVSRNHCFVRRLVQFSQLRSWV
jgi:hypothetical protein